MTALCRKVLQLVIEGSLLNSLHVKSVQIISTAHFHDESISYSIKTP